MEDIIIQTTAELSAANDILWRIARQEIVCIQDKISLFEFFRRHESVSDLVEYAESNRTANLDIERLKGECLEFLKIYNDNQDSLSSFSPRKESEAFLAPYKEVVEKEGRLWSDYDLQMHQLSNRMDWMDLKSEEFRQSDKEYDRLMALRDFHKSRQDKAYGIQKQKERVIMGFFFFSLDMLVFLVGRIIDICDYLLDKEKKGDDL